MDKELVGFLESIEVMQELEGRNDHHVEKVKVVHKESGNVLSLRYYIKRNQYNYFRETDDFLLIYNKKNHYIIELYFYDKYKEIYRFKEVDKVIKLLNKLIL